MSGPGAPDAAAPAPGAAERSSPNAAGAPARPSPYKGLTPYGAQDASYFFGREHEREFIAANLLASRLTVLYGASGVGKSSLLHAGLAGDLRALATRNRMRHGSAELAPVTFASWHEPDVAAALCHAVHDVVVALAGDAAPPAPGAAGADGASAPSASLADYLAACADTVGGDVLLILDQFEEYFLYHPHDEGASGFDAELARVLLRPELLANVLIAIREDAIARLDRFKGRIPSLFDNYLRVRHLDREAGRAAIEKPLDRFNLDHPDDEPVSIEPELVERVLDEVNAGRVLLEAEGGHGEAQATAGVAADERIETPFLQLVMTRLWEEEAKAGSSVLRLATLERLGGAAQIVRSHLDESLADLTPRQREIAASVFRQLVTPSGMKVAYTPADLAEYADVPDAELLAVLEALSGGSARILRAVADESGSAGAIHYEIFHDVLAAPILDWRRRHVAEAQRVEHEAQQREAERKRLEAVEDARRERRRARVFRSLAIASAVFAAGAAVLAVLAIRAKQMADSLELAARATSQLTIDPAESLRLALRALDGRKTQQAEDALRSALGQSSVRTVFGGHREWLNSAAFSPDGRRVATASEDGTVRVWEPRTGKQIARIDGHKGSVTSARFDQGGTRVISTGTDGTARLSDATDGRRLAVVNPDAGELDADSVAIDGDGTRIVTVGPAQGALIWDAKGKLIATVADRTDVWSVAFSPDGRQVATGESGGVVHVWDARTGVRLSTLKHGYVDDITHVEFSPDGKSLVSSSDSDAYAWPDWSVDSDFRLKDVDGSAPESPHFSADGTRVVSFVGNEAQVWRGADGRPVASLTGHQDYVFDAQFSPDGQRIVTASQDGSARVWSSSGGLLAELRGHDDLVSTADFSPDGASVVTAGADGTARVWEVTEGRVLNGREALIGAQFSSTGRRVLTSAADDKARVWNAATGREERKIAIKNDGVEWLSDAALSPDGRTRATATERPSVATATDGGVVTIQPLAAGPPVRWEEAGPVADIEFSPDGRLLASAVEDPKRGDEWIVVIRELAVTRPKVRTKLSGHQAAINTVQFSADSRSIVTASDDKTARIWRVGGGEERVLRHESTLWSASWSHDGGRVVTATNDGAVRIWDSSGRRPQRVLRGFEGGARNAVFAHDDGWIVAGGSDGTTRIWDAGSGRALAVLHEHTDGINTVAVTPDDRILTASDDRTAKIYSCDTCSGVDSLRKLAEQRLRYVGGRDGG